MSDWIDWEWTEEEPYPETLDTLVHVKLRSGAIHKGIPETVSYWGGADPDQTESSWYTCNKCMYRIVAYKVVNSDDGE